MEKVKISVEDKEYTVEVAKTEEERAKGLQDRKSLGDSEGMLFVFDKPQTVGFWMDKTEIPLDIIFIDEDEEVISVYKGKPFSKEIVEEDDVKYVLEVNQNSGIKEGDEMEFDSEDSKEDSKEEKILMKVIAPDGSTQMELEGGERIFSRKNTRTLIKMAKRADETKSNTDYKRLGNKMFKYIKQQNNRKPDYVTK